MIVLWIAIPSHGLPLPNAAAPKPPKRSKEYQSHVTNALIPLLQPIRSITTALSTTGGVVTVDSSSRRSYS